MRAATPVLLCFLVGLACPRGGDGDDDDSGDDDSGDDDSGDDDDTGASSVIDALVSLLEMETEGGVIDVALAEVGRTQRWPLREGDRWLFVTRWDDAEGVTLVGDHQGWDPAISAANRGASGVHWWLTLAQSDLLVPAAGARTKWYQPADGGTFDARAESTAYGFDEFGVFGYVAPPTDRPWRERFGGWSSAALPPARVVRVLLPAGFLPQSVASKGARTLLLHDGQNVFHPDANFGGWRVDEALAEEAAWSDVVVVAVDNASDRFDAYTQVADDPFDDGTLVGGRADDSLDLLADAVLPFVRERYGVEADGPNLAMAGSSLGGLLTLHAARRWKSGLGCAAALSPTLGWGAYAASGAASLVNVWEGDPGHGATAIYLYSGGSSGGGCVDTDGDGVHEDSDDADNYCVTTQLRDRLAGLGYAFEVDLAHWWEPEALHNEAAWAAQVPRLLEFCASAGWVATP